MWFLILAVLVLLVVALAMTGVRRGRTSPYGSVRERPPGRD